MIKKSKYILILVWAVSVISCGSKKAEEKTDETVFSKEFLNNIELSAVMLQNIEQQLKLTGKVECDPDRMVSYVPLVSGVVVSTHFNLGDKVAKGQTMAVIRSGDLSALYAEKQSLEAEIKILTRNLESTRSMYNDNLMSQKELEEVKERLNQTNAELKKVNSNLSLYGLQGTDGNFIIKAPISGFVTTRNIAPGMQMAADGEALFTIADISTVWVTANVYAGNLTFVRQGMPVDIRTMAYPDEVFHGKIDILPQVFDSEEHVLKARIIIPNTNLKLKPEIAVDITLKNNGEVKMTCIPSKALIFDDNRYSVVKKEDDNFTIVEVKLYAQTNGVSYIESGIEPSEQIVTSNQLLMYNKLKN